MYLQAPKVGYQTEVIEYELVTTKVQASLHLSVQ